MVGFISPLHHSTCPSSRPLRMQLFNTEATSKSRGESSDEVRRCKAWSQGPAPPVTQDENKFEVLGVGGWSGWLIEW